jgi:hypothetical protein
MLFFGNSSLNVQGRFEIAVDWILRIFIRARTKTLCALAAHEIRSTGRGE